MRKVIFVGSPEGSSEESLARMDEAIKQIREAADALRAALAEDRLADYLPPKRDEPTEDYKIWGVVTGGLGRRCVGHQINSGEIWPPGTALYVRLGGTK